MSHIRKPRARDSLLLEKADRQPAPSALSFKIREYHPVVCKMHVFLEVFQRVKRKVIHPRNPCSEKKCVPIRLLPWLH
jgi:hypothetical protein